MDDWAHDELQWIAQALRGHLQHAKDSGAHGVLPCDDQWLARRRQQYRDLQVEPLEAPTELDDSASPSTPVVERAVDDHATQPAQRAAPATESAAALNRISPRAPQTGSQHAGDRDDSNAAAGPSRALDEGVSGSVTSPSATASFDAEPTSEPLEEPPHPTPAATATAPALAPEPVASPSPVTRPALAPALPVIAPREPNSRVDLVALQDDVRSCTRCSLHETRTNTVFARGTPKSGICFIGEGPGADEDAQGLPFVGKAGQLLDRMIMAMGLDRDDVYICNIVKCRPPKNRKPAPHEMAACRPFLQEQLDAIAPQVIVALGGTAVEGLLGMTVGITRTRGQWRLYQGKIPVMPTFHPAYLLRQPQAKREVWQDLQLVLQHLGLEPPKR